ncbi:fructose-bisphosphate aldolase-like isoform X2 [Pseudomyrmex gracilis]|uniref:fructose-bisphosphate aldolase-like isoform X2 n=1 Tax=Pseudomyrmex gracilis TaxID=219809 RepID=UPI0009949334|nr:fructose-bisphosphate aldolase-like isoform X2 [Pseudomyrmex gracilis]XP_020280740.1 fructose-bisphosphate aldolase-like isoform X2 [Pseudomyrmex gracilis]
MMQLEPKCCCKSKIFSSVTKRELDFALRLELEKIIEVIAAPGKGLLACDESPSAMDEKFQEIGAENTEAKRREYREMLLSANKLSRYISGVILHHEMIYQTTSEGVDFVEFLRRRKILAGVKVDKGQVPLFGTEDETTTQGLDDLHRNCVRYKKDGCHFAKWRCVFSISEQRPSRLAMTTNANVLARFASICQSARMVPIVEPEVLSRGEHDIDRALQVHEEMLSILFRVLNEHRVYLEGMILKTAMVLPGITNVIQFTPQIIAEYTIRAFKRTVPVAVPAIFFLSGGQTDENSILNLNAINVCNDKKPWRLSFCYGRALQDTARRIWNNKPEKVEEAQEMLLKRAKLCSEASLTRKERYTRFNDRRRYLRLIEKSTEKNHIEDAFFL